MSNEYQIVQLESCGKLFFRIIERKGPSDSWKAAKAPDYDERSDAQWKVIELEGNQ